MRGLKNTKTREVDWNPLFQGDSGLSELFKAQDKKGIAVHVCVYGKNKEEEEQDKTPVFFKNVNRVKKNSHTCLNGISYHRASSMKQFHKRKKKGCEFVKITASEYNEAILLCAAAMRETKKRTTKFIYMRVGFNINMGKRAMFKHSKFRYFKMLEIEAKKATRNHGDAIEVISYDIFKMFQSKNRRNA